MPGSEELKPCPFCGSTDIRIKNISLASSTRLPFWAHCASCGADGPHKSDFGYAIAAWNFRTVGSQNRRAEGEDDA